MTSQTLLGIPGTSGAAVSIDNGSRPAVPLGTIFTFSRTDGKTKAAQNAFVPLQKSDTSSSMSWSLSFLLARRAAMNLVLGVLIVGMKL